MKDLAIVLGTLAVLFGICYGCAVVADKWMAKLDAKEMKRREAVKERASIVPLRTSMMDEPEDVEAYDAIAPIRGRIS